MTVKLTAAVVRPSDSLIKEKENAKNVYYDSKKGNVVTGGNKPINQHTENEYKPEYAQYAYDHLALIADNCRSYISPLALFFEVSSNTIRRWCSEHPEFHEAIKKGLEDSNHKILNKLRRAQLELATGCVLPETKVFYNAKYNMTKEVEVDKYFIPSEAAIEDLKYELDPEYRAMIDKKNMQTNVQMPIAVNFGVADASIPGHEAEIKKEMGIEE